jgi:hypothetical protein
VDVHDERIDVIPRTTAEAVHGAKPEPEEMPARRVLDVSAMAHSDKGEPLGIFKTFVTFEDRVETMAIGVRQQCHQCRYWNHNLWANNMYHDWQLHPLHRGEVNMLRAEFLSARLRDDARTLVQDPNDNDIDVEEGVRSMGVCHAYTEVWRRNIKVAPVLTHPLASCPDKDMNGNPAANLFVDKDAQAGRMGAALYDGVMRLAQGRK